MSAFLAAPSPAVDFSPDESHGYRERESMLRVQAEMIELPDTRVKHEMH
jgi:hypothetical protein